jgi:hypothetical protein
MKPPPLGSRHQNRRFGTALGHHLRTLGEAGFEEFGEASFGIVFRPGFHFNPRKSSEMTRLARHLRAAGPPDKCSE